MINFFCIPRAFVGEFNKLQRMAIGSWREAAPDCEIVLFGNETGIESAANDLGGMCIADIDYVNGRPIADYPFQWAEMSASRSWLCFISADIVLGADLQSALQACAAIARPLIIGQRWDIEPGAPRESAILHSPIGVDYFIYRPGTIPAAQIPPFIVSGGGGDNWLVWKALTAWDMTVIDATDGITAIHVNHSHPEWSNGKEGRQGSTEQAYNRRLYVTDGMDRVCGVNDAPYALYNGHIAKREMAYAK